MKKYIDFLSSQPVCQFLAIILIVLGESLFVYAEMKAAQEVQQFYSSLYETFFNHLLTISLGAVSVLLGYALGILFFKSIWVVFVLSILSMLLIEPIFAFLLFKTLPEIGAILGMFFGFIGCLFTFTRDY